MPLGSHLLRRGASLHFRRRVPAACRPFFRSAFLSLPLRTHLLAEGRRRAGIAARLSDAAFAVLVACGDPMLGRETVEKVVIERIRFRIAAG